MSDEEYMQKALIEAKEAAKEGEIPIGAIVVAQGRILARTHNLTERLHDVTAHAEMQAITAAANALGGKYLTGCTLYVTVVRRRLGMEPDIKDSLWMQRRKKRIP